MTHSKLSSYLYRFNDYYVIGRKGEIIPMPTKAKTPTKRIAKKVVSKPVTKFIAVDDCCEGSNWQLYDSLIEVETSLDDFIQNGGVDSDGVIVFEVVARHRVKTRGVVLEQATL
jgi:hypothetical protein